MSSGIKILLEQLKISLFKFSIHENNTLKTWGSPKNEYHEDSPNFFFLCMLQKINIIQEKKFKNVSFQICQHRSPFKQH